MVTGQEIINYHKDDFTRRIMIVGFNGVGNIIMPQFHRLRCFEREYYSRCDLRCGT